MNRAEEQPIYLELMNILLEKINSGTYPVGSCLPSERVLAETFRASRVSVRKTLDCLQEDGYIKKSANKRSVILKGGLENSGQTIAFAAVRPRDAMLDVYRMYYESLLMKCNVRGDTLYYVNISDPLPDILKNIKFKAVITTNNSVSSMKHAEELFGCVPKMALDILDTKFPAIGTDNVLGGRMAAEHLIAIGCRKLLFLGVANAYPPYYPFSERKQGFTDVASRSGADCSVIDLDNAFQETVERAITEILESAGRPDAIFAFNDHLAISVLKALYKKRVHVPEDISVMGFDGLEIGRYMTPALTTIVQPFNAITNEVVRWLEGGCMETPIMKLSPEIRIMESTQNRKK